MQLPHARNACIHNREEGDGFLTDTESNGAIRDVLFSGMCQKKLMNSTMPINGEKQSTTT